MCPPLTLKNLQLYQPLVAIGCPNGAVHIVDVADGMLKKEIAVHNYAVKGGIILKAFNFYWAISS